MVKRKKMNFLTWYPPPYRLNPINNGGAYGIWPPSGQIAREGPGFWDFKFNLDLHVSWKITPFPWFGEKLCRFCRRRVAKSYTILVESRQKCGLMWNFLDAPMTLPWIWMKLLLVSVCCSDLPQILYQVLARTSKFKAFSGWGGGMWLRGSRRAHGNRVNV